MLQETALKILKEGHNVFLTGVAGSGKSTTIKNYIEYLREKDIKVAVTASTGIAATVVGGQTIHSFACIGIKSELTLFDISNVRRKPPIANKIKEVEVLIIDEISMLHARQLTMVDQMLKAIRMDRRPFGGVQLIVIGDVVQLPPVGNEPHKDRYPFMTRSWAEADFKVCYLTTQYRQTSDNPLFEILQSIREDKVTNEQIQLLCDTQDNDISDNPTRLFTHNIDVDYINKKELDDLTNEAPRSYKAKTTGTAANIKQLVESCLSPPMLILKVGAKVMFTKNNQDGLWVNGTIGTVVKMQKESVVVKTMDDETVVVEFDSWVKEDLIGKPIATYTQIPLRLAYAITTYKSQGLTLDKAEIDLSKVFEYGQGYVALSRVRSIKDLRLLGINELALKVDPLVLRADKRLRELSAELGRQYEDCNV